jgi:hypothetical protein
MKASCRVQRIPSLVCQGLEVRERESASTASLIWAALSVLPRSGSRSGLRTSLICGFCHPITVYLPYIQRLASRLN